MVQNLTKNIFIENQIVFFFNRTVSNWYSLLIIRSIEINKTEPNQILDSLKTENQTVQLVRTVTNSSQTEQNQYKLVQLSS